MKWLQIKRYKLGDEKPVHELVKSVYDEFISHENSIEGNELFYNWIAPDSIARRQEAQNNLWIAWADGEVVGIIEIRDNKNITLLFVDKFYQSRGIATNLLQTALSVSIGRNPKLEKFFVHASLCSMPVYKRLGFKVTGKARKDKGIYYVPMELPIEKSNYQK